MMFGHEGMDGGWPVWAVVLMGIGMLAFLGALVWIGSILMTNDSRGTRQQRRDDQDAGERGRGTDARGVLDERLARGEIDAAEYKRLRSLIAAADDQASAGSASLS